MKELLLLEEQAKRLKYNLRIKEAAIKIIEIEIERAARDFLLVDSKIQKLKRNQK